MFLPIYLQKNRNLLIINNSLLLTQNTLIFSILYYAPKLVCLHSEIRYMI